MSAQKFRPALRTLALLLPIVAIVGMIARAEMVLQTGRSWQVRIKGYDPRDLLRGQYLRYTIDWQLQGEATCQGGSCCYCLWDAGLSPAGAPAPLAAVSLVSCSERAPCQSYFPQERAADLTKYFIPEGEGATLEKALREREAALKLVVSTRGRVAIADLLLDGEPWREALKHPPRKAP